MGFQLSAGVDVREIDLTNIVPSVDTTGAAFVGQFGWGAVLDHTIISDYSRLETIRGKPNDSNYVDWFSCYNFLSYSSNLNTIRVVDEATAFNSVAEGTPLLIKNSDHFELISDTPTGNVFSAKYPGVRGNSIEVHEADSTTFDNWLYKDEFDASPGTSDWAVARGAPGALDEIHIVVVDHDGGITGTPGAILERFGFLSKAKENKTLDGEPNYYRVVVNTQSQYIWAMDAPLAANYIVDGQLTTPVIGNAGSLYTVSPTVTVTGDGTNGAVTAQLSTTGALSSIVITSGGSGYTVGDVVTITGDGTSATAEVGAVTGGVIDSITVLTGGTGYSTITVDLSAVGGGDATATSVIGYSVSGLTITNAGSGYTTATLSFSSGSATATIATIAAGLQAWDVKTTPNVVYAQLNAPIATKLTGGANGANVTANELIVGWNLFRNAEVVDVSLIFVGDAGGQASSGAVIRHIIDNIAEHRKDVVVFFSPDKVDVFNQTEEIATENAVAFSNVKINRPSSYAFMDSTWKRQFDVYNDTYRWIPLNADIAGLAARTDATNDPWWSPAGYLRGVIKNVQKIAYSPGKTSRDALYKNGVNPVVTFSGEGTILYGDRTQQLRSAAFSKINIRRLFIVLEKSIAISAKYSLFEFNDDFTRSRFRNTIEPFLQLIKSRRGLSDFKVVCDATNNTPEIIDRSEFVASIFIKPLYSINFIQLNFVAVRTGVEFSEVIGGI